MAEERDTSVADAVDANPIDIIRDPGQDSVWAEASRHDPLAFECLYNRYVHSLYAYIFHRTGKQQDSEDLVAETFFKAVQGIKSGQFRGQYDCSFAAWVFRVAHNLLSDYHRRDRKEDKPVSLDDIPNLPDLRNERTESVLPEEALLRKEQSIHLRYLVSTLSPRRQEIITLKFFGGLRNVEIATVLGLDERTVASHLCLGIEDLHRRYVDEAVSHGEPHGER